MANEATAELYTRQSGLNKAKFKTDYEQYLADLATKYGVSNDQLNANLEARGILRSGEAGTARTRLSAAEEAARTTAKTNYDYNVANEDISLAQQLAGLMTGGSSGGTPPPAAPPPAEEAAPNLYTDSTTPEQDEMRKRGSRPAVLPDLSGVNWNALAGFAGAPSTTAPRPVRDAAPRAPRPVTTAPRPGTGTTTRVNPVAARLR